MSDGPLFDREPAFQQLTGSRITQFFGDITPVVDASFTLNHGDCVALSGPNGAGKSTLLRILATLLKPDEGTLTVDGGVDIFSHRQAIRPHIGWVGHEPMLYPELTGRENLELWASLHGVSQNVVGRWLEAAGIAHAAERAVGTWSRGMKQRLAIARSLLHQPTLVLWDEPTNGLDFEGQRMLSQLLSALVAANRMCVLITHQIQSRPSAVNRLWNLRDGDVIEVPLTSNLATAPLMQTT